uniref:BH1408 protein n=1 Tax=Halalkalibacterium halodurans (strain ATCC BAA-125 / DSM 18197 / FERM 7344 / JCM 9153 / C-125) TaxID=272558 RepID=UPI0002662B26
MIIREATVQDYYEVARLHTQVHEAHVKERGDIFRSNEPTLNPSRFQAAVQGEKSTVLVFVDEREKIGAYSVIHLVQTPLLPTMQQRKTVYISDLCVDETRRGGGIGRLIFEAIISYGKAHQVDAIELDVYDFNERAKRFYHSLGMRCQKQTMELPL